MAQQTINVGTAPNDGTGTPLRTAFQYTNSNFTELYTATGPSGNNINVPGAATITGNLTVDTNTLFVDAANNRVGVLTATPSAALDVNGASNLNGNITIANTGSPFGTMFVTGSALELQANSNATNGLSLKTTSTTPIVFSVNSSEAMRLNSTGLGVGGSPTRKLSIVGSGATYANINSGDNTSLVGLLLGGTSTPSAGQVIYDNTANSLAFFTSGATQMTLNSTGLGIGVSPAAKFDSLVVDAAECARFRAASGWLRIHPYLDATDVCRLQSVNNTNTGLQNLTVEGFNLRFNTNNGNAVIIDSLGNTVSNVNSAVPALGTNNRMVFNLTSNTNLRISVRGSDGVTRVANITLA